MTSIGWARQAPSPGPYKVLKTARVGGAGNFDYVYADVDGRRLYIPRTAVPGRISVFNLDTLEPAGEIPNVIARGAAVDPKAGHGKNAVAFAPGRFLCVFRAYTGVVDGCGIGLNHPVPTRNQSC